MSYEERVEAWFNRRKYTLDIAGLTQEERNQSISLLGGTGQEFVEQGDSFDYNQVGTVLFRWGDSRAKAVFAAMLEHDDRPGAGFFPFSASTVLGDKVWSLAIQERDWDPSTAFPDERYYYVLPFDQDEGLISMQNHQDLPTPRPELLGKVGTRWVAFEIGMSYRV